MTTAPDPESTPTAPPASLLARMRPLWPYFGAYPGTWLIIVLTTIVGAATEPLIPARGSP